MTASTRPDYPLGRKVADANAFGGASEGVLWDHATGSVIAMGALLPSPPPLGGDAPPFPNRHGQGEVWSVLVDGPDAGQGVLIGDCRGFANAAKSAEREPDGFVVAQSGGFAFPGDSTFVPAASGLQQLFRDGRVEYLAQDPEWFVDDLIVGSDGTIYFTDLYHDTTAFMGDPTLGRVLAYRPDGSVVEMATGLGHLNGIIFDVDDTSLIVNGRSEASHQESSALIRLRDFGRGPREYLTGSGAASDGMTNDEAGIVYAPGGSAGVVAIDPADASITPLPLDGGELASCASMCFGGRDFTTLYGLGHGIGTPGLFAWEGMPNPGRTLSAWPGRR